MNPSNPLSADWLPNQPPDYFLSEICARAGIYGPFVMVHVAGLGELTMQEFLHLYRILKSNTPIVLLEQAVPGKAQVTHFFKRR
jgi:hypothetical protein